MADSVSPPRGLSRLGMNTFFSVLGVFAAAVLVWKHVFPPPPPPNHDPTVLLLRPLIFVGGFATSRLYGSLNLTESPPGALYCPLEWEKYTFHPAGAWQIGLPTCYRRAMTIQWNISAIISGPVDFGAHVVPGSADANLSEPVSAIRSGHVFDGYEGIVQTAESAGYNESRPPLGVQFYDFRKSPFEWRAEGLFEQLKNTIETLVNRQKRAAIILSHSMGGSFLHHFLATFVSTNWKDRHIFHWISLAGAYGGTGLALGGIVHPWHTAVREIAKLPFAMHFYTLLDRQETATWPTAV